MGRDPHQPPTNNSPSSPKLPPSQTLPMEHTEVPFGLGRVGCGEELLKKPYATNKHPFSSLSPSALHFSLSPPRHNPTSTPLHPLCPPPTKHPKPSIPFPSPHPHRVAPSQMRPHQRLTHVGEQTRLCVHIVWRKRCESLTCSVLFQHIYRERFERIISNVI